MQRNVPHSFKTADTCSLWSKIRHRARGSGKSSSIAVGDDGENFTRRGKISRPRQLRYCAPSSCVCARPVLLGVMLCGTLVVAGV